MDIKSSMAGWCSPGDEGGWACGNELAAAQGEVRRGRHAERNWARAPRREELGKGAAWERTGQGRHVGKKGGVAGDFRNAGL
jgi:hypothetical protein